MLNRELSRYNKFLSRFKSVPSDIIRRIEIRVEPITIGPRSYSRDSTPLSIFQDLLEDFSIDLIDSGLNAIVVVNEL